MGYFYLLMQEELIYFLQYISINWRVQINALLDFEELTLDSTLHSRNVNTYFLFVVSLSFPSFFLLTLQSLVKQKRSSLMQYKIPTIYISIQIIVSFGVRKH